MRLRVELDEQTFERLARVAEAERRPIARQVEVLVRRALGLPFPWPVEPDGEDAAQEACDAANA